MLGIKNLINIVNAQSARHGLQPAMFKAINHVGSKLEVVTNQKTKDVLKEKGCVIVANHPAEADVLVLLASLEKRKDIYIIINSNFTNICKNASKYMIPVYINNRLIKKDKLHLKLRLWSLINKIKIYTPAEEHTKNIEGINKAIEIVNDGGVVVIFPGGGGDKGKWFSGVGHLIKGIKNKKDSYVVQAFIEGTSNLDYLRLAGFSRFLPKFKVTFDNPILMHNLNSEAKLIASELENNFYNWTGILTKENYQNFNFKDNLFFYLSRFYLISKSFIVWVGEKLSV